MNYLIGFLSAFVGAFSLFLFGREKGKTEGKIEVINEVNKQIEAENKKVEEKKEKINEEINNTPLNDLVASNNKRHGFK